MILNAYRNAKLSVLLEVEDSAAAAFTFTDGLKINIHRQGDQTVLKAIDFTHATTGGKSLYSFEIPLAEMQAIRPATIYPFEILSGERFVQRGEMRLSDVLSDTWKTETKKLTVTDVETYAVTVSESDAAVQVAQAAATAAEAAQTAAELAQSGAETAETNAEGHETAASGYATDAEGFKDDAETAAETALTTIKGVKDVAIHYTLIADDAGYLIEAVHGTDKIEVTVPADTFPDYTTIAVERTGLAEVEIIAGGATVINGGRNISEQYHIVAIQNKGGNVWTCIGGAS